MGTEVASAFPISLSCHCCGDKPVALQSQLGGQSTEWVALQVLFTAPGLQEQFHRILGPAACIPSCSLAWLCSVMQGPLSWLLCKIFPSIQVTEGVCAPAQTWLRGVGGGGLLTPFYLWHLAYSQPAVLSAFCLTQVWQPQNACGPWKPFSSYFLDVFSVDVLNKNF